MEECVLFSPVGSTDPIRGDFDGPMLHIVRYYKPKKVYLFLTAEMAKRDREKDIYVWTLKQLDPTIEIVKLYHEDIDKPQVMDKFDKYYPEDLRKIYEENPDCTVLANVTSGTAQMMTSLRFFAATADFPIKLKLIAVDTPAKKSNHSIAVNDEYDKEASWANNIDNITDSSEIEVRCKEIKHDNIKKGLVKNIIIKYLETYDYKGALTVLQTAEYFFAPDLAKILRAADYRLHLEHSKAQKYFDSSSLKYKEVYPVQSSDCRDIFEYILHLKKLGARNNLLEFAQGISPVLYRLSYMLLKKSLNIPMDDYTFQDRGVRKYEERKLPDIYKKEFINMNYKTPINTSNLLPLIAYEAVKQNKVRGYELIKNLRDFEKNVRNIAAHEISAISKDTFKNNAGTTCEKIINDIEKLYQIIFAGNANWNSYDHMNEKIMQYL
ncbi:CRISPR type III-A/MTUBE-associated protein Csm6 [Pectinatus brassicae]|uniref:CRISPR type III-A/MTUBE-associated protein Csm6 n=3 Tax=Pectinatus brassicae TaxID=862415 RepID=A0A840UML3_9FIRM|nr:hypothetical protein [Pectinatus brassicae]MBB5335492.1 CRISPR type III-A/MTUBE-associated protein Csm6 [Pectinatus brassicae]